MTKLDRRTVLKSLAGFAGTYLVTATAPVFAAAPRSLTSGRYRFPQGVASGDPQPDGIVLWTRVESNEQTDAPIDVRVQIAKTPDFSTTVIDEMLSAHAAGDYTMRLVVQGLDPDTIYFYRFAAAGDQSRLGRTRTAPLTTAERPARFAFALLKRFSTASCAITWPCWIWSSPLRTRASW